MRNRKADRVGKLNLGYENKITTSNRNIVLY